LVTQQNLAGAYMTATRSTEAIALAEKVWQARVRKHGDDHAKSIAAMESLASIYQTGYKMKEALALLEQARQMTAPKLGEYHPLTLAILSDVARIYMAYGRLPEAIALYEQVRERRVMILGGYHPSTLATLEGLGWAYRQAGETRKALSLFEQAATGVERLAYSHTHADQIIAGLALCLEELGQYEPAEAWRRKWIAVAKEKYRPDELWSFAEDSLAGLGANLFQQKKYAAAEPILRESLMHYEKHSPEAWRTFRTQSQLGGALLGQQKYAEAEPLLVQSYQSMRKYQTNKRSRFVGRSGWQSLTESLERVVQLYVAWDRLDEAAKWRKELEILREDAAKLMTPKVK
jgi:tetratricopeptide (TPR) repeat protein